MAVFGLSVCGLLGFVYWSTVGVIEAQSDATIEAEITGLEERYRARGLSASSTPSRRARRRSPARGPSRCKAASTSWSAAT